MAETKDISANPTQRQTQIDDRYDPHRIEEKWHARWQAEPALFAADTADSSRKKYYVLEHAGRIGQHLQDVIFLA